MHTFLVGGAREREEELAKSFSELLVGMGFAF